MKIRGGPLAGAATLAAAVLSTESDFEKFESGISVVALSVSSHSKSTKFLRAGVQRGPFGGFDAPFSPIGAGEAAGAEAPIDGTLAGKVGAEVDAPTDESQITGEITGDGVSGDEGDETDEAAEGTGTGTTQGFGSVPFVFPTDPPWADLPKGSYNWGPSTLSIPTPGQLDCGTHQAPGKQAGPYPAADLICDPDNLLDMSAPKVDPCKVHPGTPKACDMDDVALVFSPPVAPILQILESFRNQIFVSCHKEEQKEEQKQAEAGEGEGKSSDDESGGESSEDGSDGEAEVPEDSDGGEVTAQAEEGGDEVAAENAEATETPAETPAEAAAETPAETTAFLQQKTNVRRTIRKRRKRQEPAAAGDAPAEGGTETAGTEGTAEAAAEGGEKTGDSAETTAEEATAEETAATGSGGGESESAETAAPAAPAEPELETPIPFRVGLMLVDHVDQSLEVRSSEAQALDGNSLDETQLMGHTTLDNWNMWNEEAKEQGLPLCNAFGLFIITRMTEVNCPDGDTDCLATAGTRKSLVRFITPTNEYISEHHEIENTVSVALDQYRNQQPVDMHPMVSGLPAALNKGFWELEHVLAANGKLRFSTGAVRTDLDIGGGTPSGDDDDGAMGIIADGATDAVGGLADAAAASLDSPKPEPDVAEDEPTLAGGLASGDAEAEAAANALAGDVDHVAAAAAAAAPPAAPAAPAEDNADVNAAAAPPAAPAA